MTETITNVANHVTNLLEKDGALAVNTAKDLLTLLKAAVNRDLTTVFAHFQADVVNVRQLIADVRAEFGI